MTIGIDLGGTNVRVALVDEGKILKVVSEPTKSKASQEEVLDHIIGLIESVTTPEVTAIGMGVPAVVDLETGTVYDVVAIPSWKEVPVKAVLEAKFGVPVSVNNDCNCFGLGVSRFGEAKGYRDAVCVTLGTGVGSCLIIDGKLYSGQNTGAGEIGNIPYLDKDYEYYCSSRVFVGMGTTGKELFIKAGEGDSEALSKWDEFGGHIGKLVSLIINAYDPQVIVFGGSIAGAFDFFKGGMYKELESFPYQRSVQRLKITTSSIDNAAILGAASLCE